MRRFPSGIAVLTLAVDGERYGVTVGSLVSLSLEPALVGVSIGVHSPLHEPLRDSGRFALSLLAGDQAPLAQHFARSVPPLALWAGIPVRADAGPEPRLAGALAWLGCATVAQHEVGDHTFFVGEVVWSERGREGEALAYLDGAYVPVRA